MQLKNLYKFVWRVRGDHPVLSAHKGGLTLREAAVYAASLREIGFKNVEVINDTLSLAIVTN